MTKSKMVYVILHSGVVLRMNSTSVEYGFVPKDCKSFDHFPSENEYFEAYPQGAPLPIGVPEKEKV